MGGAQLLDAFRRAAPPSLCTFAGGGAFYRSLPGLWPRGFLLAGFDRLSGFFRCSAPLHFSHGHERRSGAAGGFPCHFDVRREHGSAENLGGIARRSHDPRDGCDRGILLRCNLQLPPRWHDHQLESRRRTALWLHGRRGNRVAGDAFSAARAPRRSGTQPRAPQWRRARGFLSDRAHAEGRLSLSSLRNARGKIVGTSAIARDLSAERQSEEAMRRSEKLAIAGRLAASIAHEINNPLQAVVDLLYLARHDSSHAAEYLTQAEHEVGRVARLAQQTLGFVRDTSSPGSMDPAAIMDEVLRLYSSKLLSRQIRVTRRYRSSCEVAGYSGELRQLLANLLVNAVDAMADGGSLQVRVAMGRDWSNGREGIRITVADNGSGIPRDKLRQIFEPFYTTKKETGTGL